ncbi:helix-turn-helix domain-containing protein [Streptomyces sp. NPDC017529]|uniref:helix-turn-helix domain-containing protein n=1 Tax=Streptomyces sp. NPDC017529 TaxID=3365000 RepID=UPI0037B0BAB3
MRLEAAGMFAAGRDNMVVAKQLRVSVRSVQRWRRAWAGGGPPALCSKSSATRPKLSDVKIDKRKKLVSGRQSLPSDRDGARRFLS